MKKVRVEFSRRADFSSGVKRLAVPKGTSTITPGNAFWKQVRNMGRNGEMIFWRVKGRLDGRKILSDQTFSFRFGELVAEARSKAPDLTRVAGAGCACGGALARKDTPSPWRQP
jgi:hypothetical protein